MSTPTRRGVGPRQKPKATLTPTKAARTLQKKFDMARILGRLEGSIASLDSILLLTKYFEENRGDPRTHQFYRHWILVEKANLQNKAKNICLEHEILPNPPPPVSPEPPAPGVAPELEMDLVIEHPEKAEEVSNTHKRPERVVEISNTRKRPSMVSEASTTRKRPEKAVEASNTRKRPEKADEASKAPIRRSSLRISTRGKATKKKGKVTIKTPPPPSPSPSPSLSDSESDSESEDDSTPLPPPTIGVRRSSRTLTVAARQAQINEQSAKKNKSKGKGKAVAKPVAKPIKKVSKPVVEVIPEDVPEVDPVKRVGIRLTYKAGGFM